jgi:hypothetical protein
MTGWDEEMNRRSVVPIVVKDLGAGNVGRMVRTRKLRTDSGDFESTLMMKLSENRLRLDRLSRELDRHPEAVDTDEIQNELDYLKANIQLGLVELSGDIEELPTAEELVAEALA